jgi:hypothetical protein
MPADKLIVFIHGWSVRSTDTYGELPDRLKDEARQKKLAVDVKHVYLSKYVSFRDEVRVEDLARGMEAAIADEPEIQRALADNLKLCIITHSTGGPVARDWWFRFYVKQKRACPMSHLIMLAPANFGSALAQLGKSTASRLKSWFEGVEPGQGVLDWLELGSPESWEMNESWVRQQPNWFAPSHVFQFVLTGQSIDRSLYDHVNKYTDETGSDGVVRVAAANLNATYVKLVQEIDEAEWKKGNWQATHLALATSERAPPTALAVLPKLAHSGDTMGIMRSVKMDGRHATVTAILKCLAVDDGAAYAALGSEFEEQTKKTQAKERTDPVKRLFLKDRIFQRPPGTQLILRLTDDGGHPLLDFDFLLTAWDPKAANKDNRKPNPNLLPEGFFIDRQRNRTRPNTLTYFLNHEAVSSATNLGIRILPRPEPDPEADPKVDNLFVHYARAEFGAAAKTLLNFIRVNETLLVEIVMKRIVRKGVFRLTTDTKPVDFTNDHPADPIG